ncbi:Chloride intracellular channel exc-4 [Araneus ventricosus]|uniref:Chloride intracellular channel exc-4 n=1 Tax=Araneus ventricosus TaxID=182803 RepID=A0A4Y2TNC9_ARAVE|nr:Chloride intracellular channel exc-4 [Araneus ventricosus]GBO02133.1 Chloride intracellular channel exc-4 [Araneus ventricosus]
MTNMSLNMFGVLSACELASTIDGRRKGACLFCQEYFMDLYLLAELKTISLKVTTVDMLKPPPDFRSNFDSTPPPILIDRGQNVLENEKIERYIMKNVPGGHNLFVQDKDTATVIENLYSKFKLMLTRRDEQAKRALLNQLRNIDAHLEKKQGRFLTGDTMCCFDCELMPRLQHIRIAVMFLKLVNDCTQHFKILKPENERIEKPETLCKFNFSDPNLYNDKS